MTCPFSQEFRHFHSQQFENLKLWESRAPRNRFPNKHQNKKQCNDAHQSYSMVTLQMLQFCKFMIFLFCFASEQKPKSVYMEATPSADKFSTAPAKLSTLFRHTTCHFGYKLQKYDQQAHHADTQPAAKSISVRYWSEFYCLKISYYTVVPGINIDELAERSVMRTENCWHSNSLRTCCTDLHTLSLKLVACKLHLEVKDLCQVLKHTNNTLS